MFDLNKILVKESHSNSDHTTKLVKIDGYHSVYVDPSPTGNCQIFSIAHFDELIAAVKTAEIARVVAHIGSVAAFGIRQVLIDIEYRHETVINAAFKGSIKVQESYESTNGSDMILYLIKVDYSLLDK